MKKIEEQNTSDSKLTPEQQQSEDEFQKAIANIEQQGRQQTLEAGPQNPELLTEAGAEIGLERQSEELKAAEEKQPSHVMRTLSGWRKKIGVALLLGSSMVATGCNSSEKNVPSPEGQKTESRQDGFLDNGHERAHQATERAKAQFKHMKKMQGYHPSQEAKDSAKEMQETQIVQPIDDGSSQNK